jgi:hypothetical protein
MKTMTSIALTLGFLAPLALSACSETTTPTPDSEINEGVAEGSTTTEPVTEPGPDATPATADYGEDGMQGAPPVRDSEGLDAKDPEEGGGMDDSDKY